MIEKMDMKSMDITEENVKKICYNKLTNKGETFRPTNTPINHLSFITANKEK